jgi:hypothetical protein
MYSNRDPVCAVPLWSPAGSAGLGSEVLLLLLKKNTNKSSIRHHLSDTPCDDVRMNDIITILLGAVLPLITAIWQIARCTKMVRRMRNSKRRNEHTPRRMLNVTLSA